MKHLQEKSQRKHIEKIYNICTDIEKSEGLNWYKEANFYSLHLSELFKLDSNIKVCGIISALSPAVNWERNKIDAHNFLALASKQASNKTILSGKFGTYKNNVLKAIEIYNLVNPTAEKIASILLGKTGFKTMSFFYNIYNLKNTNIVTIDRHAVKVANNIYKGGGVSISKKQYFNTQKAYIKTAKKLSIKPYQLQAVVWVKYRQLRNL
tara:strand:+ start:1541 stop:2167 length:627 start_codon:yes stop_codon:yes gene_type:complete